MSNLCVYQTNGWEVDDNHKTNRLLENACCQIVKREGSKQK